MTSSMDAFFLCFEGQKPLVGLGVEPQRHRPLQKPSFGRLAIFLDHLLDARALFCPMGRVDGPHSISVLSDGYGPLSQIAQPGSSQWSLQQRAERRRCLLLNVHIWRLMGELSAVS